MSCKDKVGFQVFTWDLKINAAPAPAAAKGKSKTTATPSSSVKYADKGKYSVVFRNGAEVSEVSLEIK